MIQNAQKAEYNMGVYLKKMLCFLGAINVTPGPMTIFKKKVFNDLGVYRYGHNTEDMEIAYRMQKNHYKIEHCNDAYVYTDTPGTIRKLYRQEFDGFMALSITRLITVKFCLEKIRQFRCFYFADGHYFYYFCQLSFWEDSLQFCKFFIYQDFGFKYYRLAFSDSGFSF